MSPQWAKPPKGGPKQKGTMEKLIVRLYAGLPFKIVEVDSKSKMIGHQRKSSVLYAPYTPAAWAACQEYNKRLHEWEEYENSFLDQLRLFNFK